MHFVEAKGILSSQNGMNLYPWLYLLRQPQRLLPVCPRFRGYRGQTECAKTSGTGSSLQKKEVYDRNRRYV